MTTMGRSIIKFALLLAALGGGQWLRAAEPATGSEPVFLYSRYYNARGENRYEPDGAYKEVMQRLKLEFDLRVHDKPITPENLAGVRVVLIANPSDKAVGTNPPPPHISMAEARTLDKFIRDGGALILMENQENHNLETKNMNLLLMRFGLQTTNAYTDAKEIIIPQDLPVIGGLRWAYYTGNSIQTLPIRPARLSIAVTNDVSQTPLAGTRNAPGLLLAGLELGRGRVVVVTDSGWITDMALKGEGIGGIAIKEQDNWEIFRRLARWSARLSP